MESLQLAQLIVEEAIQTKAQDLKILDLKGLISYADYFVLATATSTRQAQAMSDRVYLKIKKELGQIPLSLEGKNAGSWVLMDYGDVVFHIFLPEMRHYYAIEELWSEAAPVPVPGEEPVRRQARGQAARKKAARRKKPPSSTSKKSRASRKRK